MEYFVRVVYIPPDLGMVIEYGVVKVNIKDGKAYVDISVNQIDIKQSLELLENDEDNKKLLKRLVKSVSTKYYYHKYNYTNNLTIDVWEWDKKYEGYLPSFIL